MKLLPSLKTLLTATILFACATLGSCGKDADVVVYVSLDEAFATPLIRRFEKETGLRVEARVDTEASKTVGHVRAIREEASRPRCDVFWNNEVAQTISLAEAGLLQAYESKNAADIPERFKDAGHMWTGFAARARILIVNTDLVPDPSVIRGYQDLLAPEWEGQVGIARPLTGTTLTHATALYSVLGEAEAREFLGAIQKGSLDGKINLMRSNGEVMRQVGAGAIAWGFTDTDDFNVARLKGWPVAAVYPDQGPEGLGTMVIPNTISMIKGAPHPDAARRFIDWVLSVEVERELAFSRSAQIPVRAAVERPDYVRSAADFDVMDVDYMKIGKDIATRTVELKEMFLQ